MTAGAPARFYEGFYEAESSFAEDVDTFATQLLPREAVDVSGLVQEKIFPEIAESRPQDGEVGFAGAQGGSFPLSMYLTGHGGTAAGALTQTDLHALMVALMGAGDVTQVGTTVSVQTSATVFDVAGGTIVEGALIRIGAKGDGRGEGQFYRVLTVSGSTVTLANACPAAPAVNDVIYAAQMVYDANDPCEAITSLRFQHVTPNGQHKCHGCFLQDVAISGLNAGELPVIDFTIGVARFVEPSSPVTFPDASPAHDAKTGRAVAGGSTILQVNGTATRNAINVRTFGVNFEHEIIPVTTIGGVVDEQIITAVRRARLSCTVDIAIDKPLAGTTTFLDIWNTESKYQVLTTLSIEDGKAVAIYLPNAVVVSPRPTQEEIDSLNSVRLQLRGTTNSVLDSAIERASWQIAMA